MDKDNCRYRKSEENEITRETISICNGNTIGARLCDSRDTRKWKGKIVPICTYDSTPKQP